MKEEFHFYNIPLKRTYIRLRDEYRFNLFKKVKRKINKPRLLKIFCCCENSLYAWEAGKRAIPSIVIIKISKLIGERRYNLKNIEKNITYIYSGKKTKNQGSIGKSIKNPKFPLKLSPELARLVANIIGDGTINVNWYFNTIYFNKEKVLINKIKEDSLKIFGEFKYNINKGKDNVYYINLPSIVGMILYYWFGDFSSKKARIPELILNSKDKSLKCSFLQGFFDDEGTIDKKSKTLKVFSSNNLLVRDIRMLLKSIGIRPTRVYPTKYKTKVNNLRRTYFTVSISNRESIQIFKEKISFIHPRKQHLLNNY